MTGSDAPRALAAHVALRAARGLGPRAEGAARRAPPFAAALCKADGGRFVRVVDVAVRPGSRGLGAAVVARRVACIEAAPPPASHVAVVSSERAEPPDRRAGVRPAHGMDRLADPAAAPPP